MNQVGSYGGGATIPVSDSRKAASLLAERVREAARALGCPRAWARAAGRHVILGMGEDEAFARVTPLGAHAYALSFRSSAGGGRVSEGEGDPRSCPALGAASTSRWAPLLLIDALTDVVEHALIGEGAIHRRLSCM